MDGQMRLIPISPPDDQGQMRIIIISKQNQSTIGVQVNSMTNDFLLSILNDLSRSAHPSSLARYPLSKESVRHISETVDDIVYKLRMSLVYTVDGESAGNSEESDDSPPRDDTRLEHRLCYSSKRCLHNVLICHRHIDLSAMRRHFVKHCYFLQYCYLAVNVVSTMSSFIIITLICLQWEGILLNNVISGKAIRLSPLLHFLLKV